LAQLEKNRHSIACYKIMPARHTNTRTDWDIQAYVHRIITYTRTVVYTVK